MMDKRLLVALYQTATQEQKEHLAGISVIERALQGYQDCLPEQILIMEAILMLDDRYKAPENLN